MARSQKKNCLAMNSFYFFPSIRSTLSFSLKLKSPMRLLKFPAGPQPPDAAWASWPFYLESSLPSWKFCVTSSQIPPV